MEAKKVLKRGFTLIELLVVIAIIGVLSSIVLASLNTARSRGSDAAVKGNLSNLRSQAEIFYDTSGHYGTIGTVCSGAGVPTLFADSTMAQGITAADTASAGAPTCATGKLSTETNASSWAVSVPLSTPNTHWCVDSKGTGKQVATAGVGGGATTPAACP